MFQFLLSNHHTVLHTAIKVLGTDANFECTEEGIKLQAMDNSRVALVAVDLLSVGFTHYRCDRPMSLSVDLARLAKVLKWAEDDDRVALTATDAMDVLKLTYEAKSRFLTHCLFLPKVANHVENTRLTSLTRSQLKTQSQSIKLN